MFIKEEEHRGSFIAEATNGGKGPDVEAEVTEPQGSQPEKSEDEKTDTTTSQATEDGAQAQSAVPTLDKDVPFHKHPRFQKLTKTLADKETEISQLRKEMNEKIAAISSGSQPAPQTPEEFIKLFGDNREAWPFFEKLFSGIADQRFEARERERTAKETETKQAEQKVVEAAEQHFTDLGEDIGQDLSNKKNPLRNELLDICERFGMIGMDGVPLIANAYEYYKERHESSPSTQQRKDIAKKTSSGGATTAESVDAPMTSEKLKKTTLQDRKSVV